MSLDIESIKSKKSISELLKFSIINIDKPSGPTSFQVSQYVKNLFKVNKTSHFGTLDPQVSGVLPVGLSRACRLNEVLMHRDKTYVGIMRLHMEVDAQKLKKTIQKFLGKIQQLPPVRSRVKRAIREREVKTFNILEQDEKDILFETQVQAGTYIRKLCDDMGKEIGGAHMLELRRTHAGIFEEKTSRNLYEVEQAFKEYQQGNEKALRTMLIPGEIVTTLLPCLEIRKDVIKKCLTGSPIFPSFLKNAEKGNALSGLKKDEFLCVVAEEQLIGYYRYTGEETVIARPEFVLN
ncbi:MAG: RNA-guided pseudouridylation complex pseudouridine synthase subunit Cbf5 [Nanoarchaeota archaeon]